MLQDRSRMSNPAELKFDPITANWTYIRWLGDREAIERQTITSDKTIVDRSAELSSWVDFCYQVRKRGVLVYAFANNHFSGHAPATIEQFGSIWQSKGFPPLDAPRPPHRQPSLIRLSSSVGNSPGSRDSWCTGVGRNVHGNGGEKFWRKKRPATIELSRGIRGLE